jgi:hypothetical protein
MALSRNHQTLDPDKISETIEILSRRIHDRFPDSGLYQLCLRLHEISRAAKQNSTRNSKPILWLRVGIALLILLIIGGVVVAFRSFGELEMEFGFNELIQTLEAGINDIVFIGIAIFFLTTVENRIKRNRALSSLHELRSIAHIIDMHQLTKDPDQLLMKNANTASSPQRTMDVFLMNRYLDYCTELLSLTGKVGALYVQHFNDEVALASVNEIESLTTGLSQKIWQKIMILDIIKTRNEAKDENAGI